MLQKREKKMGGGVLASRFIRQNWCKKISGMVEFVQHAAIQTFQAVVTSWVSMTVWNKTVEMSFQNAHKAQLRFAGVNIERCEHISCHKTRSEQYYAWWLSAFKKSYSPPRWLQKYPISSFVQSQQSIFTARSTGHLILYATCGYKNSVSTTL